MDCRFHRANFILFCLHYHDLTALGLTEYVLSMSFTFFFLFAYPVSIKDDANKKSFIAMVILANPIDIMRIDQTRKISQTRKI